MFSIGRTDILAGIVALAMALGGVAMLWTSSGSAGEEKPKPEDSRGPVVPSLGF